MRLAEDHIRQIIREEILKNKRYSLGKRNNSLTLLEQGGEDTSNWGDAGFEEEEDTSDWGDEDPGSRGSGGDDCRSKSRGRSYKVFEDVRKMQRIFMGSAENARGAAKTPNLGHGTDGKWGPCTQDAWLKFLREYLVDDEYIRVGASGNTAVMWKTAGHTAASDIMGKSYTGDPQGAYLFVKDLLDRGRPGEQRSQPRVENQPPPVPKEEEETAPSETETETGGDEGGSGEDEEERRSAETEEITAVAEEISTEEESEDPDDFFPIEVLDDDGDVAFRIWTTARNLEGRPRRRRWLGRALGEDFLADFRGEDTVAEEDRFIISWGRYPGMPDARASSASHAADLDMTVSEIVSIRFEDNLKLRNIPDDEDYPLVLRCLERERRKLKGRTAETEFDNSIKGDIVRALGNRDNRYQRLTVAKRDGSEWIGYRPRPDSESVSNANIRRNIDRAVIACKQQVRGQG